SHISPLHSRSSHPHPVGDPILSPSSAPRPLLPRPSPPASTRGPSPCCGLYLPITQPKETSSLYTCIKESKCYF
uniref:Uncharacterized protein n=1 Tax=Mus spicilegus TaxID=10103 RepID=A0A8C6GW24_MUSSI